MNHFTCEAIFSTLTNVDFDPDRFVALINQAVTHRESSEGKSTAAGGKVDFTGRCRPHFTPEATVEGLVAQGENVGVKVRSGHQSGYPFLQELLIYGIKGVAAYADHAAILGQNG